MKFNPKMKKVFTTLTVTITAMAILVGAMSIVIVSLTELKSGEKEWLDKVQKGKLVDFVQHKIRRTAVIQVVIFIFGMSIFGYSFLQRTLNRVLSAERKSRTDFSVVFPQARVYEFAEMSKALQNITNYHLEISQISSRIARGDLTVEVRPSGPKDIFGNIFKEMCINLRNLVSEANSVAMKLADAAKSFTAVTDQSTQTMTQLANSISQIAQTATQVSQSVQDASLNSNQTLLLAQTGEDALKKAANKMSAISSTTEITSEAIEELGEISGQIGDIVKVITRIADQTNLLALNAAIEAARAGEAGRGFAVVADEVRKLAEDSANSAGKISGLISRIQEKTGEVVEMTAETNREVKDGVITVSESEKKFSEIMESIRNINIQIESIAAATVETASLTEESSSASEEQVAGIEELSASAQNLLQTGEQLKDLVSRFKVG
ncbi:MAG TPA: hypothetical protein DHV62_06685 [Elusimicrobia bacterium]|jgi:methyl-accepting chemotaxis protein|nr:hypothetical protein [Elusimicrobiota bacterium]